MPLPLHTRIARRLYRAANGSQLAPLFQSRVIQLVKDKVAKADGVFAVGDLKLLLPGHLERWYVMREFEPITVSWLEEAIKPGMIAVDVGAHIGFLSLVMARLVGKDGQVIALEPEPTHLQYLRKNVELNQVHNVRIVRAAAGPDHGMREFYVAESSDCSGFYESPVSATVRVDTVQQVPLDELVESADFVKIDVEGAEMEVLKGMRRLLRNRDRLPSLVVEWLPGRCPEDDRGGELVGELESYGYELTVLDNIKRERRSVEQTIHMLNSGELDAGWYGNLACEMGRRGA